MLIGVTGEKFNGKDTVARAFADRGYVQIRFADPLKAMLRAFYSFFLSDEEIERRIEGDLKETPCPYLMNKTPRDAMQTLGTEWGRNCIHPELWVATLIRRSALYRDVVVSDVRFLNEAAAVKATGGKIVKVIATDAEELRNGNSTHQSEREVKLIAADFIIYNDRKTMAPINAAVDHVLTDAPAEAA